MINQASGDNSRHGKSNPIPIPNYQFDHKNEIFKRRAWDKKIIPYAKRLENEVRIRRIPGYRKLGYTPRNASWNIDTSLGYGSGKSNENLYSRTQIP